MKRGHLRGSSIALGMKVGLYVKEQKKGRSTGSYMIPWKELSVGYQGVPAGVGSQENQPVEKERLEWKHGELGLMRRGNMKIFN